MNESKATQTRRVFSMTRGVEVNIRANVQTVWALLTDAQGFSRWNSTVSGIEGQIREGERLRTFVLFERYANDLKLEAERKGAT